MASGGHGSPDLLGGILSRPDECQHQHCRVLLFRENAAPNRGFLSAELA